MTIRGEYHDAAAEAAPLEGVRARTVAAHAVVDVPIAQAGQAAQEVLTAQRGRQYETVALAGFTIAAGGAFHGVLVVAARHRARLAGARPIHRYSSSAPHTTSGNGTRRRVAARSTRRSVVGEKSDLSKPRTAGG
jgi:hypothetical protein